MKWWNQIADAMAYTHSKGIVHRDIKPSNIFLDNKGNIKLLDFGIAKIKESISMTQTGAMMGTLMYMSPEQVEDSKHIGPQSDIYSLAVTFVHLLKGKAPYDNTNSSDYQIRKGIVEIPLDLSEVPAGWRGFLAPYLEKDPTKRPALQHFVPVETDRCPSPKPSPKKRISLTWLWLLIAVGVIIWGLIHNNPKTPAAPNDDVVNSSEQNVFENKSFTVNGVTFDMIAVKGGTFTMGSTGVYADSDEMNTHNVTVSNFYIGKFEATQKLWKAVMGNNPRYFKGDDFPVEYVSWDDCQKFITKLTQLTGQNFRLPTEAEWEYAARGGNKSNGYMYSGSNSINNVAWYTNTTDHSGTKPVGTKLPNELGIYDMSGNVWEWCQDWYGNYSSSSQTNPTGPSSGWKRVRRGGSWGSQEESCRVSKRDYYDPDNRYYYNGFRLVLVP